MKLHFRLPYIAQPDQHLAVELHEPYTAHIPLSCTDGQWWEGSCELTTPHTGQPIGYAYSVWQNDQCLRRECNLHSHIMHPESAMDEAYWLNDHWRELPQHSYLFSSAFSGHADSLGWSAPSLASCSLTLRVLCPSVRHHGQVLAIVGESETLGCWDTHRALRLDEVQPNQWQITLDVQGLHSGVAYKYVLLDATTGECRQWEEGDNRHLNLPQWQRGTHHILPEVELYFSALSPRIAGTAVPVFSLRSEGSQGVGDFGDLRQMIDWVVMTGQRALQILPINDTTHSHTRADSYPYNAISIYAFHPMYIDLRQLPALNDGEQRTKFERAFRQLNVLKSVDYESVNKLKRDYLRLLYRQHGSQVLASAAFADYLAQHSHWLYPYALFCHLRDKHGTSQFTQWGEHATYRSEFVTTLCRPDHAEWSAIAFHLYLQYVLHTQLSAVSAYAQQHNVVLKGDIPIGIAPCSVEAWTEPHLFHLNSQAGAPPDAFAVNGQNWGFPTYNWEAMRRDDYRWWKQRFAQMATYFTAYRIDHILGFFRIWEIPHHSRQGLLGQFSPALPMTPAEIEAFGLPFQQEFMTRPFINDDILTRLFGQQREWVQRTFLVHSHHDVWRLRPEYSTQRAIDEFFAKSSGQHPHCVPAVRDALFQLVNNVLFVEDHRQSGRYHPRINADQTLVFERLQAHEKDAFRHLHWHFFYERHNDFWYASAMQKLPSLCRSTPMLACGEDLGMVPACVPWAMRDLHILSLEIERMPKDPNQTFGRVEDYPVCSVATIGTHDMNTLRGWWLEDERHTARYYYEVLQRGGDVPPRATAWVCQQVIARHLHSPSLLCILALQDWLAMDEHLRLPNEQAERINVPDDPHHEWKYRMHLTLESLMQQMAFNNTISTLVHQSHRA